MTLSLRLGAVLLLTFAGCHPSEPSTQAEATRASHDTSPGDAEQQQEAPEALRVERDSVSIGGTRIDDQAPGRIALVEELRDVLRGSLDPDSPTFAPGRGELVPYGLEVADAAPMTWLKSVFQTAAFSGFGPAVVSFQGQSLRLRPYIAPPPGAEPHPSDAAFPEPTLIVSVDGNVTKLWRASQPKPDEEAAKAELVATLPSAATLAELETAFSAQCEARACNPGLLYASHDLLFARLETVVRAFATAAARTGQSPPLLEFHIVPPPEAPIAPSAETRVSGRLDPKDIQAVVRGHFDRFRHCYEAGLAEDPQLTGRVAIRFVIGRDGRIASLRLQDNELPAVVTDCLVSEFRQLTFPKPKGGIVTVTYPIHFSPG